MDQTGVGEYIMEDGKFELTKDGANKNLPSRGNHDDKVWALALGIYAGREEAFEVRRGEDFKW
ncbi:TPA: hypothetical protein EYP27_01710 [Candidatus Bathyarchaeota archaeon]|nr:hypothetical protein [Candidatus Bathyarchaeota archaeon]